MTPETPSSIASDSEDLFDREVRPLLQRLKRRRARTRAALILLVFVALTGWTVLVLMKLPFLMKASYAGWRLYAAVALAIITVPFVVFRHHRKRIIISLVLAICRHADLIHASGSCLKQHQLRQLFSDLKPRSAHAKDGFAGIRQGLNFWFNEVDLYAFAGFLTGTVRIFHGWLLCIDLPQPRVPPLSCTLTLGARGTEPVLTPIHGDLAEAKHRFPPELRTLAARLASLAGARQARLAIDGQRFILAIDTGRDLFEGITELEKRMTPALFARSLEELDTLTRVVDELSAALQAQIAAPSPQPGASLGAAEPASALNVP
ncbi:hypothetical protein D9623_03960 [Azospirillum brasilense]|uniref:DUF3137 domain-containing protein n=1 Tax=Azospirillum brasilense TaxID=192 RepID=A0A0P0EP65_AZOBR|nr:MULTISPECIES: hypothetical protein [Azospirillum]ALJ36069.1 hypothetical protein AMK58_11920 [Azospirillum brasilense]MDW7552490.1 hypothetical protein [Azospirillum brasilense]MDW7592320.1 hypothetical protein [Azospirillum brasilense]MDW7627450.1 hypothetical protein [Azospirillum brasilense]MDW7628985.1 hypothetical protein [Azospirillum brasilense]